VEDALNTILNFVALRKPPRSYELTHLFGGESAIVTAGHILQIDIDVPLQAD